MAAAPPAGTVTFLCTAVSDANSRWTDGPDATAAAMEWYDSIGREIISRHGGYVFAEADGGSAAAFPTAVDAAEAAVELQRRLLAERDRLGFTLGVGLHTGETSAGTSSYLGPEADRAARLTSIAYGGQVVVSETTELLLRGRMALRTLGEHRLRDLQRRMTVHQLVAEGLPSEFPALRGDDPSRGNLPEQPTSFVGRDALLVEVADLVRANRLVTLERRSAASARRGSRFEVGAEVAGEFPDGVWVVELASVSDAASVPAAIATVLGVTPHAATPTSSTLWPRRWRAGGSGGDRQLRARPCRQRQRRSERSWPGPGPCRVARDVSRVPLDRRRDVARRRRRLRWTVA